LEQAGTSWNKMEQDGTRWNKVQVRKLFGIGGAKLVHQGKPSRGLIGERLQGIQGAQLGAIVAACNGTPAYTG
jgi:hypothetical protein